MEKKYSNIWGAIIGDIAGSRFEFNPHRNKDFELLVPNPYHRDDGLFPVAYYKSNASYFTDDTVMTLAIAKAIMECKKNYSDLKDLTIKYMQEFGRRYPYAGYGINFRAWIKAPSPKAYHSFGNGSAMRVSPVAYFAKNIKEVKKLSKIVTEVTHNHPEGIKGAEVTAVCTYMALNGYSKESIVAEAKKYYDLDFDYGYLVRNYRFDETCPGSVPQSLFAFAISDSYEDTIRTAISMGGDADTMAAIAGAIAGAYYGVPEDLINKTRAFLTPDLLEIVQNFEKLY